MIKKTRLIISLAFIVLFLTNTCSTVHAETTGNEVAKKQADSSNISRIIKLTQVDNMFIPNELWITQGETIKFVVTNKGERNHEMLIGSRKELRNAAKMRRMYPDKNHSEPGLIKLAPGEQKELIRQFDQMDILEFACPLPGHSKGMRGKIYVEKK